MARETQQQQQQQQQMEKLHDSVLDAIHNALSKESLIKKLVLPFNETLSSARSRGVAAAGPSSSSRWEWQKNTALLVLENRNQQLQHLLTQAETDAVEHEARAHKDRRVLGEALQRSKEEALLLARARDMRARLIEQMQVMARSKQLQAILCTWRHFCRRSRKTRALQRAERLWTARRMLKLFDAFVIGCHRRKQSYHSIVVAARHRSKVLLLSTLRLWWRASLLRQDAKNRLEKFMSYWSQYRLRSVVVSWHTHCIQLTLQMLNEKRVIRMLHFNQLRSAWREWHLHVTMAREKKANAEFFIFLKLAGSCLESWHNLLIRKKQRLKQLELGGHQRQVFMVRAAMTVWLQRAQMAAVMATRLTWFLKRKRRKTKWIVMVKWCQHVAKMREARTARTKFLKKLEKQCMKWAFEAIRKRSINKALLEWWQQQQSNRIRGSVMRLWLQEIKHRQTTQLWVQHMHVHWRNRQLLKHFSSWLVYTEACRRMSAEDKLCEAEARVELLETQLNGAAHVQAEMEILVAGFETERSCMMDDTGTAIARTPRWISGFLDVELRWSRPAMENKWLPAARAGHSAVSLQLGSKNPPSTVVVFGGYNGQECFNDVLIFDCGDMCWERPAVSVALGSVCPPPMRNHSACPLGASRMLLFGGFDGATEFSDVSLLTFIDQGCVGHLNETWLLDLQLMAWTSPDYVVGVPPSPRRSHAAAIIDKCMFVFGGYNGKEHLADLHILDLESMAWQLCVQVCGDLPSPRRQHAMAAVGKHLVIHGGYDGQKYLDDIYSFNTDSRIWKRWPIIAPCKEEGASVDNSQSYGRSMQTMVVARQQLVIFGGVCDQGALQDVLFLENAAAISGLQLQRSLSEETAKVHKLQLKVVKREQAFQVKSTELTLAQTKLLQLQSALKVEGKKRSSAIEGQRVLLEKLRKARDNLCTLVETCCRLEEEQESLQKLVTQYEQQRQSAVQFGFLSTIQRPL
ncbi:hypothetical protein CY35_05G103700 [Sphagnum magellanicum]|nr:hypothetical protein CY35_05G103700 [Sphagnum magellanicum]